MYPVPFTMQLRSATARQSENLVHHYEHITTNGRRALKVHFNDAPGNPKTLTFSHQPRSGLKLKLKLKPGKVTPKTTTEAKKQLRRYERLILRARRTLRDQMRDQMNSDQGNPQTLTSVHQPRSGGLRLRFGKRASLKTPLCIRLSGEQTRFIRDWVHRHTGQTDILDNADVSEKADPLIAAAEDQQMDGGEI
ncbi:hypothetical protein KCU83_g2465, partial [Aureobasidium melanogenum]